MTKTALVASTDLPSFGPATRPAAGTGCFSIMANTILRSVKASFWRLADKLIHRVLLTGTYLSTELYLGYFAVALGTVLILLQC